MQQWTNKQQIPGIPSGAVDGNVFFGDLVAFKKYGYKRPEQPSPSPSVSPSSSVSPSPSSAPIDWEKKYTDEVLAHGKTKERLKKVKDFVATA